MKLLLTSFGVNIEYIPHDDGFSLDSDHGKDFFFRMPVVSMSSIGPKFVPDYSVFLLFDEFIIDGESLSAIRLRGPSSYFSTWLPLIDVLEQTGRLHVVDFAAQIEPYRAAVRDSVEYDLRNIDAWVEEFEELAKRWKAFAELGTDFLRKRERQSPLSPEERRLDFIFSCWEMGMFPMKSDVLNALRSWRKKLPDQLRQRTRKIVQLYLEYIACNMLLSRLLDASVYEWADIQPLYMKKAQLALDAESGAHAEIDKIKELFSVVTPDFEPRDPETLIRALDDPRIASLRNTIRNAVETSTPFDNQFVTRTLVDVYRTERSLSAKRRMIGWVTTPLSLIPWVGGPVQKVADSLIASRLERRLQEKQEWFLLISDISRT